MAELKDILYKINALKEMPEVYILKQLIDKLRVPTTALKVKPQLANDKIRELIKLLHAHPEYSKGLTAFILTLLNKNHRMALFTDAGILSDHGFFSSLFRLLSHRFIPILPKDNSFIEMITELFDGKHDARWLTSVDAALWDELIDLLRVDDAHTELVTTAKNNILNAMVILSYRINGIGLHPDLMEAYPELLDYSAAFVAQNQEAVMFADAYREVHQIDTLKDTSLSQNIDPAPLLVMVAQCQEIVNTIRKRIYKTGISIRLTNMLLRLEQSLKRMNILIEILANDNQSRDKALLELTKTFIVTAKTRYSIPHLISDNTHLLSRKVTENSGRVGEHYITTDKSGYTSMFRKAAIGGFVIAFMATMKILMYDLELAPIGRAFVNSMIYGLGFVFIHIIHGTVATKQPAMTAAAIASTISKSSGKKSHKLSKVSELLVDITRTQFIAILGNVLLAVPVAFLISYGWVEISGSNMISVAKADYLLYELDPFNSLALVHAAIAGVFLFMAGLIAGYYDNLALFNNIGERITRHKLLLKILPQQWLAQLGCFIEKNLGAIMGNFLFGVFLGSTATVGYILGMPLDIRHIAFSSANFAHGIFNTSANHFSFNLLFISLLGVALIGALNLLVSFSLAIFVALRSKGVRFSEWKNLRKLVFTHLLTHPRDFFLPRPEPMQYSQIDHHGHMIYTEDNKFDKNEPLLKNLAIRRLSEIEIEPDTETTSQDEYKCTALKAVSAEDEVESQLINFEVKASQSDSQHALEPKKTSESNEIELNSDTKENTRSPNLSE